MTTKPIYQQRLFDEPEIIAGDVKKKRGDGVRRRKVIAAKVTYSTWQAVRKAAKSQGLTVSSLIEQTFCVQATSTARAARRAQSTGQSN